MGEEGALNMGGLIKIKVTDITSMREELFDLYERDTVGVLKRRIEARGMGLAADQRLAFAGRILGDDEHTLQEDGVVGMCRIILSMRKREALETEGAMPLAPGAERATAAAPREYTPRAVNQPQQQHGAGGDEGDDVPTCRICHGTDNGPEEERLFSPCLCRGSMRFVHVGCLNRWRAMSTNPRSFYACDACQFQYSLRRTRLASYCEAYGVLEASTAVVGLLLVTAGGVVSWLSGWRVTGMLYELCQWVPPWHGGGALPWFFGGGAWADLSASADFACGGVIILGLAGLVLAVKRAYDDDPRQLMSLGMVWLTQGTLIIRVLVALGLAHSLTLVHARVREEIKGLLSRCGSAILEVGQR